MGQAACSALGWLCRGSARGSETPARLVYGKTRSCPSGTALAECAEELEAGRLLMHVSCFAVLGEVMKGLGP